MVDPQRVQAARQLLQQRGYTPPDPSRVQAAKQLLQQPQAPAPQPAPKQDGFFKSLVKDPIKTLLVKPAVRVAQAGIAGYGALTGNQKALDVSTKDTNVHIPILGNYNIEAQKTGAAGVGQIAADALKTATYLVNPTIPKAGPTATLATKVGTRLAKIGVGATTGYASDVASNLEQGKNGKDIFKPGVGTAIGTAIPVLGGVRELAGGAKNTVKASLQKKAVSDLTEKYNELFTGTKSGKNVLQKSVGAGKNPSEFLAKSGYIIGVGKGGKIDTQPVIQEIQQNADSFEGVFSKILQEKDATLPVDQHINLSRLAQATKSRLATPQNKASGNLSKMNAEVDSVVNELRAQFGDKVNLSTLNMVKRGQWAQTKVFDATKPAFSKDVSYNLGKSAKELIEKHIPEADIRAFNAYLGDHYDTINNLQKLDGKTVNGGRLGKYFARTIGAIAGAKGGPIGSLLGAEAGDTISGIMQSNSIANPVKRVILSQISKESPVYGEAQAALQKLKLGQLKLPAPKAGSPTVSVNVPINQPSKVVTPGTTPFKGTGALSRQDVPITDQVQVFRSPLGTATVPKVRSVVGRTLDKINETLNDVTPGLSTKDVRKRVVSYVDESGKTQTLKNLSIEDAKNWTAWLQRQGLKYTVKLAGIAALVGAAKVGANRSKTAPQATPQQ